MKWSNFDQFMLWYTMMVIVCLPALIILWIRYS